MRAVGKNSNGWNGRAVGSRGHPLDASDTATADSTTTATLIHPRRKVNPLSPPTTLELSGVRVHFPFRPYPCQETYMQTVMNALLKSENALLESPTGTGKTLCLLCACLAWQRQETNMLRHSEQLEFLSAFNKGSSSSASAAAAASGSADCASSTNSSSTCQTTTAETLGNNSITPRRIRPPTIIYASRTHSQLSQVVRELRNTRYRPTHAVLGSREQMCIHPKVKKANATASDINHACNKLGQDRKCRFRNNLDGFTAPSNEYMPSTSSSCCQSAGGSTAAAASAPMHQQQSVRDMEELVAMGKAHSVCPFYYTRKQIETAELILVPYNYLFDKDARGTTLSDIPWDNAVVIFDEAHNLESFASESASFDISSADISGCINEVVKAINIVKALSDTGSSIKLDNLIRIKALFLQLEEFILNLGPQTAYNGAFMMEIFQQGCGINHANHQIFIDEVRKINDMIMDLRGGGHSSSRGAAPKLEHFIQCIKRVFGSTLEARCLAKAAFYRVHVSPKTFSNGNGTSSTINGNAAAVAGRTISYWCFAPALAMEELADLKIRSILVTSGTLSPLTSYGMELGLNFPHTLENPHIISPEQIHVRVIGKGVTGKLLNSSFERRKDKDYALELGNTLVSIAKVTPAGMLIFFPSYSVMESCIEEWGGPSSSRSYSTNKNDFFAKRRAPSNKATPYSFPLVPVHFATDMSAHTTPWKRMLATKSVVTEPKSAADLPDALAEFKRLLALPKSPGCILMGVCRGKISEGIDFTDEQSRAVVITGLPFPPSFDPKVKMKREFLDSARANSNVRSSGEGGFGAPKASRSNRLSGHEWYSQQAHRAVNQAIGRVIRHQKDYGAVLLLDSRFDQPQNHAGLSKWLRSYLLNDEGFGPTLRGLVSFYKNAAEHAKATEAKAAEQMAKLPAAILEYDTEPLEDEPPSKVAVVRRSQDEGEESTKEHQDAYVPPSDIIARLDVKDLVQTRESENPVADLPTLTDNKRVANANDAVFGTSKNLAVQFMVKVKENLTKSDQSTIRKAIVAMKGAGEKRDMKSYLNAAKGIVVLVNRCDQFEAPTERENKMLLVFFGLLSKHFRKRVETMSFEMVFDVSSLGSLIRERLESEYDSLRLATAHLLQTLWCRSSDVPLPSDLYLHEAKGVLEKLPITENSVSASSALSSYLKLVPTDYHVLTHAWVEEKVSSRNMQRIKVADKMKAGDVSVNSALFPSSYIKTEPCIKAEAPEVSANSLQPPAMKRKLVEPFAVPRSKQTVNPYAKKKPSIGVQASITAPPKRPTQPVEDKVAAVLKQAQSEAYVKPHEGRIIQKKLKTNAPNNITCFSCSDDCKEPFVAECGHMACLSCWLDWLNRSPSCMVCRARVTKDTLARVVYERKPGSGAPPTLTQLCAYNDSDDELEVTRSEKPRSETAPSLTQPCDDSDSDDELEITKS